MYTHFLSWCEQQAPTKHKKFIILYNITNRLTSTHRQNHQWLFALFRQKFPKKLFHFRITNHMINALSFNKVEWSSVNFIINCNKIKKKETFVLLCVPKRGCTLYTQNYFWLFCYDCCRWASFITFIWKMIIYCFDEKIGRGE